MYTEQIQESFGAGARDCQGESSRRSAAIPRRKRKFPGPAGILPDLTDPEIINLDRSHDPIAQRVAATISSSQRRGRTRSRSPSPLFSTQAEKHLSFLSQGPQQELAKQLSLNDGDENCPTKLMNINWIHTNAARFISGAKVPFLLGVLLDAPELPNSNHVQKKTPCVKIVDSSGTIEAAFDPSFVKLHGKDLKPGSAVAVTSAGLLHFKRNIILTITSKNVIGLASSLSESQPNNVRTDKNKNSDKTASMITENGVKIVFLSDFSVDNVLKSYRQFCDPVVTRQQYLQNERTKEIAPRKENPTLFTHISSDTDSCGEFFFNFDEDDELFLACDTEQYLSSQQQQQQHEANKSELIPNPPKSSSSGSNQTSNLSPSKASSSSQSRDVNVTVVTSLTSPKHKPASSPVKSPKHVAIPARIQNQNYDLEAFDDEDDWDLVNSCDIFESTQCTPGIVNRVEATEENLSLHSTEELKARSIDQSAVPKDDLDDDSDFFNEIEEELNDI